MSKLYRGTATYAFGEYGYFHLPALLNHFKVPLKAFRLAALALEPEFTKILVTHLRPETKHTLRHYRKKYPKADARALIQHVTPTMEAARKLVEQIKGLAERCIEDYRLYEDEKGVKSEIVGSFSYNDHYEDRTSDYYKTWKCPDCGAEEEFVGEGDEPFQTFHKVTGPYYECTSCDVICRPEIRDGEERDNEEEWDEYTDHLDHLLTEMSESIEKIGLPAPSHLHVAGTNLDWRGRSGYTTCAVEGEALARSMTVDSEFSISGGRLYIPEEGLPYMSCGLSHHDASGGMVVQPMWACEIAHSTNSNDLCEDEMIVGEEIFKAQTYAKMAQALLCGDRRDFEFQVADAFEYVCEFNLKEAITNLTRQLALEEDHWLYVMIDSFDPTKREAFEAEALRGAIDFYLEQQDKEVA